MTLTAQGTKLRCDHAGCQAVATIEKDAWAFCAAHAGATPPPPRPADARPEQTVRIGPAPQAVATITTPAGGTRGPIGLLLEEVSGHSSKRVRNLGEKIEKQLDDLRALVASLEEGERRKQAEKAAKEKARAEVARLEQQLAAAKAALRGTAAKAPAAAVRVVDGVATAPHLCADCQGTITRPVGTPGSWPSRCGDCKAKR